MMLFPKKMELNRRPCNWMCLIPLSLMGIISTALPLSESKTFSNLDCTNDLENHMCCYFEAQNCSLYNLTLQSNDGHGMKHCTPNQCDSGQCCCSVQMTLVLGESFTAVVLKEGQRMESKIINIRESIKPKTPTIISVEDVNGSFRVSWKTNTMGVFGDDLKVNVTYHKKGDTEMVSEFVKPATINGLKFHEISRHNLEPSTRYVVSVKSYTDRSGKFSDSSNEWEFTTRKKEAASPHIWHLVVIVSLSFAAVIITSAAFGCYNSFKAKCLDTVAICPNPKLFDMRPGEEQILKLPEISLSSISTDSAVLNNTKPWSAGSLTDTNTGSPQQSSGISAGSSSHTHTNTKPVDIKAGVQDALGKAFPLLRPVTSVTTNQLRESNEASGLFSAPYNPSSNNDPGSTDFENMSYFIRIPSYPHQKMTDSSEVQTQADMVGDSAYQPIKGDMVTCPDQQVPACPLPNLSSVASSLIPTDMSWRQCNPDSGRFSYAEDSSLASTSSDSNTVGSCDPVSRVEAGCECFDDWVSGATEPYGKSEEAIVCDENPCYGRLPAGLHSFHGVDNNYQAFQNVVGQPDVLFPEQRSGEREEHVDK